jgi:RecA/RadA recombinase
MSSRAIQRLESLLQTRRLDNTLAHRLPAGGGVLPTGLERLDSKLGGGWPQGEVSELVGRRSSGCTGVLVATLAAATRRGGIVGLVDAFDRFDPVTAARAGLDLDRVLWVRGAAVLDAIRALDLIVRAGGFAVAALDLADAPPRAMAALPFTTWLRLAHANEGRETVCLLMGEASMGRSARGRSVHFTARRCWSGAQAQSRRFLGFQPSISTSKFELRTSNFEV